MRYADYPTRCRYCESAVFCFECSCGSQMLFDELGEPGGAYAQITIHAGALGDEDDFSFTFLIARRMLAEAGVRKGDLVRCRLRGAPILHREPVRVCDGIERAA